LPFGEEIAPTVNGRSEVTGYSPPTPDATRQRFTDKERDAESGVDYFGARYLSTAQGRFTSADPYNPMMIMQNSRAGRLPEAAARSHFDDLLENPQSWNRYGYVRNNPLALIDPFGESPQAADGYHLISGFRNLTSPLAKEFA